MSATTPTSGAADLPEALHRVIDDFERRERGIPQAHIASALVAELRAAIAAQSISAEPAGAVYAELPESICDVVDAADGQVTGMMPNDPVSGAGLYTEDQLRDFADRTHALRVASHGQAPAQPDQDGETFRTAARLGLTLRFYGGCAQSGMPGTPSAYEVVSGQDRAAAMREAVQRAAAVNASGGESQRPTTPTAQAAPSEAAPNYEDDTTSREQYKRMFHAACADLGEINEALGLDPDDGGAEPILSAIENLKAAPAAGAVAGWQWVPVDATDDMVRATDKVNFENEDTDGTMHNVWHTMLAAAPQPAPPADSVLEDAALLTSEQEYAIRQGHEIAASDGYFDARPQIESNDRRKVFQAGFERGWDAARKQGGAT